MTLPKEEEGLGLRDFKTAAIAASMKRVYRIWTNDESIWTVWMRRRYIKNRELGEITKRPNIDSALWVGILDDGDKFNNFLICDTNYEFH